MISMEECELIGAKTEEMVFKNVLDKLNARHQSTSGLSYCNQLSITLAQTEGIMQDSFPEEYAEIISIMHEEFQSLDELEQHSLYIYLFTSDKDEGEIVDSMFLHFEEWMEERGYDFLSAIKHNTKLFI